MCSRLSGMQKLPPINFRAVLVLCGVSGVQSQSITVDRQMKRYNVPRLAFINKLDRQGSNPQKIIRDLRTKLRLNASLTQLPIGLEDAHRGVVDLVTRKAFTFEGSNGVDVTEGPVRTSTLAAAIPFYLNLVGPVQVPADMSAAVEAARAELVEALANADEEFGDIFLLGEVRPSHSRVKNCSLVFSMQSMQAPTVEQIKSAMRRATIALKFVPVFLGSAYKNKGVQLLLDGGERIGYSLRFAFVRFAWAYGVLRLNLVLQWSITFLIPHKRLTSR